MILLWENSGILPTLTETIYIVSFSRNALISIHKIWSVQIETKRHRKLSNELQISQELTNVSRCCSKICKTIGNHVNGGPLWWRNFLFFTCSQPTSIHPQVGATFMATICQSTHNEVRSFTNLSKYSFRLIYHSNQI